MILPDVNVLVYVQRGEAERHAAYRAWLDDTLTSGTPVLLADSVLSGVVRILTHPRIWNPPTPLDEALTFVERLRAKPNAMPVRPGAAHWEIFTGLCRDVGVQGNLVPDAWLAALAIEQRATLVTTDRDFARFPGLRWRHPLSAAQQ